MDFLKSHPAFLPTLLLLSEHIAELLIGSLFSEDAPDARAGKISRSTYAKQSVKTCQNTHNCISLLQIYT